MDFNPRSREGSDAKPGYRLAGEAENYNPRSREGSDSCLTINPPTLKISIHAPARGATLNANTVTKFMDISIHAPARGATQLTQEMIQGALISIHAPARGAT